MEPLLKRYLLRVDLTSGKCNREPLSSWLLQEHIGGRSLGVALLKDYTNLEPLEPDMPLVLSVGPLCGTPVPLSSHSVLTGRCPLTGTIFSVKSGGTLSRCMLGAGLAAILIHGKAASPVLLEINPSVDRLLPADKLWGVETDKVLQQITPDIGSVAVIGTAGEREVLYASILTSSGEPFSRGGFGAVMGAKRLKGIILKATPAVSRIADSSGFQKAMEDLLRLFRASPFLMGPFGISENGTSALVDLLFQRGMLPGRSFTDFSGDPASFNSAILRERYRPEKGGCDNCLIACKRVASDGIWLPDYEALAAFSAISSFDSIDEIVRLCKRCGEIGVDPVSFSSTVATFCETDGGSMDPVFIGNMLEELTKGTSKGISLAKGSARLASEAGVSEVAITVKGLELPPFDPRASTALALGYATSPHGGCHLTSWPISSEILRKPVPTDRFSFDGKARIVAIFEDANAAVDSLVLCRFVSVAAELQELAAILAAVTGMGYSPADLKNIGRKTILDERSFNRKCGFTDADDTLPLRFFSESANGLPPVDRKRFEQELSAYHRIRAVQCQ